MDDRSETAWRAALQQRGKEWVQSELRARPGRPDDVVCDVVFEPPYPTRAFCVQWCAEQDNRIFRLSWHSYTAMFMLFLFIVCFWQAMGGWKTRELIAARHLDAPLPAEPARVRTNAPDFSVGIPNIGANSKSGGSVGSSATSPRQSSLCGFINYDTTRCPPKQR